MKAAPEDRLNSGSGGSGFPTRRVVLVLVIAALLWFYWSSRVDQQEPELANQPTPPPPALQAAPPPAPDIPVPVRAAPEPELVTGPGEPPAPTLPPLAQSDPLVREQLASIGITEKLDKLQQSDHLVQLGAALIDTFSRGVVNRKLVPVDPPEEAFSVEAEGEQLYMNAAGYQRYDDYAQAVVALDTTRLVKSFHLLRPLYEQAYGQLGLRPDEFDNAVMRMLDRVLATPEIDQPIALTRKSVMYQYADPALEKLTPLQKQLLRMGPDNLRRIKAKARAIRAALLQQQ